MISGHKISNIFNRLCSICGLNYSMKFAQMTCLCYIIRFWGCNKTWRPSCFFSLRIRQHLESILHLLVVQNVSIKCIIRIQIFYNTWIKTGDRVMAILPRIPEYILMQVTCLKKGISFLSTIYSSKSVLAVLWCNLQTQYHTGLYHWNPFFKETLKP